MRAQLSLTGWRKRAPSKAKSLRELLSDGRWHGQQSLQAVAGMRFGARIFDLHNEFDVGTGLVRVHYQKRTDALDDSRVQYRQTDQEHCDICSNPKHMRPSDRIRQLETRVAELEAENALLRGGR